MASSIDNRERVVASKKQHYFLDSKLMIHTGEISVQPRVWKWKQNVMEVSHC